MILLTILYITSVSFIIIVAACRVLYMFMQYYKTYRFCWKISLSLTHMHVRIPNE